MMKMKIDGTLFKRTFLKKAAPVSEKISRQQSNTDNSDSIKLSSSSSIDTPVEELSLDLLEKRFSQAVLAIGSASSLAGIPALASLSQEVGQALVSPQQESDLAASIAEQYQDLPKAEDPRLDSSWTQVSKTTNSPFPEPVVVDSFFIYAQSDSRGMYIGTNALESELSNDTVLAFTLAHEEAHRQNRDSAGSKGLETLVDLTKNDDQLFPLAMSALQEGRHQNEREADLFGAQTVTRMGQDLKPVYDFLADQTEDLQHPGGAERCQYIRQNLTKEQSADQ